VCGARAPLRNAANDLFNKIDTGPTPARTIACARGVASSKAMTNTAHLRRACASQPPLTLYLARRRRVGFAQGGRASPRSSRWRSTSGPSMSAHGSYTTNLSLTVLRGKKGCRLRRGTLWNCPDDRPRGIFIHGVPSPCKRGTGPNMIYVVCDLPACQQGPYRRPRRHADAAAMIMIGH